YHTLTLVLFFSFNPTPPTPTYTLSLHDALPIYGQLRPHGLAPGGADGPVPEDHERELRQQHPPEEQMRVHAAHSGGQVEREGAADRKSTRLNSSHDQISYAVFCLKKKKKTT